MRNLLKLLPDVPVEIALSCTDGVNVVSPRGTPAVKYTLVDGRTFFATAYVDAKFKKMKIEACERIVLCMRNIDGKNITLVERVPSNMDLEPASQAQTAQPSNGTDKAINGLSLVIANTDETSGQPILHLADEHDLRFEPPPHNAPNDGSSPHTGKTKSELMTELSLIIANAGKGQPNPEESDPDLTGLEPPPLSTHRNGASGAPLENRDDARPIGQLERALKTAILAAHSAEKYGKEIGYMIRFDQESVKCMAVTVLIGMQGGRY